MIQSSTANVYVKDSTCVDVAALSISQQASHTHHNTAVDNEKEDEQQKSPHTTAKTHRNDQVTNVNQDGAGVGATQ